MALRRSSEEERLAASRSPLDELVGDSLQMQLPRVVEYLTATAWEDGSPRQTATLMILWEEGRWKCCLHDRAEDRSGWVSGRTLMDVLVSLEAALLEEGLDWRRRPKRR